MAIMKSLPMIKAKLPNNNLPSDNTPRTNNGNLQPSSSSSTKAPPFPKLKQKQQLQTQKPSVTEIERAIGAGVFRDRDTERESGETLFDKILSSSLLKEESSVERQLRETGEWIIDKTEKTSESSGKKILLFVFQWIFPIWVFAIMLALGIIKLPFSSPLLDDLLS